MNFPLKAEITIDYLVKIILLVIGLIVIIYIVGVLIPGELASQGEKGTDVISGLF